MPMKTTVAQQENASANTTDRVAALGACPDLAMGGKPVDVLYEP
jgi:hypothetical protein